MVLSAHRPASKRVIPLTAQMAYRRLALWLLVLSLMAAQLLGLMHRVTHAGAVGDVPVVATSHTPLATVHTDANGWVAALFAMHAANDASCKLYDAHGQAGAPKVPLLSLPVAAICSLGPTFQSPAPTRTQAPFEARAPPLSR